MLFKNMQRKANHPKNQSQ